MSYWIQNQSEWTKKAGRYPSKWGFISSRLRIRLETGLAIPPFDKQPKLKIQNESLNLNSWKSNFLEFIGNLLKLSISLTKVSRATNPWIRVGLIVWRSQIFMQWWILLSPSCHHHHHHKEKRDLLLIIIASYIFQDLRWSWSKEIIIMMKSPTWSERFFLD